MNTLGSVAYGWGALCLAAGVGFYFAKKEIDQRRRDQQHRGERPTEILSWQERVARQEALAKGAAGQPPLQTSASTPGGVLAAIQSKASGGGTSNTGAASRKDQ